MTPKLIGFCSPALCYAALLLCAGPACADSAPVADSLSDRRGDLNLSPFAAQPQTYLLAANGSEPSLPSSRDALFDDEEAPAEKSQKKETSAANLKGFVQMELARTVASPSHWSKMLMRADVSSQGSFSEGVKWKLGARLDYDPVYSLTDYYSAEVARNQRFNLSLRENYLDVESGDWDFRLGKQHVVWGEMVGLFFADVVSARDMRQFILPEFDIMRIPQWAARAEYFKDDYHAELLWIPVASYDKIGKPGSEFYPYPWQPAGVTSQFSHEARPSRSLSNSNYGLRLSTLKDGWDVSAFAYSSMDVSPTFYRDAVSVPGAYVYQARHDRIRQYGSTLAKDFGSVVLKGEAVYTHGRQFSVMRESDADGVVPQNTLDWALGLDFTLPADTRLNLQVFQRAYFDHDPDLTADKRESGVSVLINHKLSEKLEAQALWIASTNRTDWLLSPRVTWSFAKNWRLAVGGDIFHGPATGLFGQFNRNDRIYSEIRYSF